MQGMLLAAMAALGMGWPLAARAADEVGWPVPDCTSAEQAFTSEEEDAHRTFSLPVLRYAAGERPKDATGVIVKLRVDEGGRVTCMFRADPFDRPTHLSPRRSVALKALADGQYRPFLRDGTPVPVFITERIDEEDVPAIRVPMPEAPLAQVKIELRRTGCFGSCPAYRVEIDGTGAVHYVAGGFVDVRGPLRYRIPVDEVAALVAQARAMDFWSLRDQYEGGVTDMPSTHVTFRMGDQVKQIEDYAGLLDGMPGAMIDLEKAIDAAARTRDFVVLSNRALDLLVESGFPFHSPDGAAMLAQATENEDLLDDAPLVRLLALGAPTQAAPYEQGFRSGEPRPPLIEVAARNQRRGLVEALLAQGVIGTSGQPDPALLQAAFVAAIAGGDLETVRVLWDFSPKHRPSLTYLSGASRDDDAPRPRRAPVTLALDGSRLPENRTWEGFAIAQWLASLGANLRSSDYEGKTLMHIAADAGDIALVRWLAAQGLDINARDRHGIPPTGYTIDEDVLLAMLELGADPKRVEESARLSHLSRVNAWLDAHRNSRR